MGAKSVCGSAAEWGRAERGAASHPPDSLRDHHVDGDGGEEEDEQDGAGDGEEEVEDPSIYTLNQSLKIPI